MTAKRESHGKAVHGKGVHGKGHARAAEAAAQGGKRAVHAHKEAGKTHAKTGHAAEHKTPAAHKETAKSAGKSVERAAAAKPSKKGEAARAKVKVTAAVARKRRLIAAKAHPVFRGRFGKKLVRPPKSKKWDKWRKPRGIDIVRRKEDGAWPSPGYRTPRAVRGLHPQGLAETRVFSVAELEGLEDCVVRIGGAVGRRKKQLIREKAAAMGLRVLN